MSNTPTVLAEPADLAVAPVLAFPRPARLPRFPSVPHADTFRTRSFLCEPDEIHIESDAAFLSDGTPAFVRIFPEWDDGEAVGVAAIGLLRKEPHVWTPLCSSPPRWIHIQASEETALWDALRILAPGIVEAWADELGDARRSA